MQADERAHELSWIKVEEQTEEKFRFHFNTKIRNNSIEMWLKTARRLTIKRSPPRNLLHKIFARIFRHFTSHQDLIFFPFSCRMSIIVVWLCVCVCACVTYCVNVCVCVCLYMCVWLWERALLCTAYIVVSNPKITFLWCRVFSLYVKCAIFAMHERGQFYTYRMDIFKPNGFLSQQNIKQQNIKPKWAVPSVKSANSKFPLASILNQSKYTFYSRHIFNMASEQQETNI